MLTLDLDGFKSINDTLGHEIGDPALTVVAERLKSVLRAGDPLARVGGDEFVVVTGNAQRADLEALAERMREVVGAPLGDRFGAGRLGASVGIARFPEDGRSSDQLLRAADLAMYWIERLGKGGNAFADDPQSGSALLVRHEPNEPTRQ